MSGRSLILLIFLALVLLVPNLNASELELQELSTYLNEIDLGLNMIEAPLNEIENSQEQREQRLIEIAQDLQETAQILTQRELRLEQKETLLIERERVSNEREKDLDFLEILYSDMENDLTKANRKLENGWKWLLGSLIVGIAAGVTIDEFIRH